MLDNINFHKVAVIVLPLLKFLRRTEALTMLRPFGLLYGLLGASYVIKNIEKLKKDSTVWKIEKAFLNTFIGPQYHYLALYYILSKIYFVYVVWNLENKKRAIIFSTILLAIWVATTNLKKEFDISEKDYDMVFTMSIGMLIWLWDSST